jgi:hypothetical protein
VGDETVHLLVRVVEDGLYATSPQAPGLVYARPDLAALRADLDEVLSFHFNRPGPFRVVEHHERHYDVGHGELVTRIANDEHRDERQEVYTRIGRALTVPAQAESLIAGPSNRVGEVVYVCAVPTDTIGWLVDQLDPRGDAAVAALAIAETFVFTIALAYGDGALQVSGDTLGELGYTTDTQLAELMRDVPIVTPVTARPAVAS